MKHRARKIVFTILLLSAAACGGKGVGDFRKALEQAWTLERKGQYLDAAEAAQKAAAIAGEDAKDRDNALFLRARMLVKAGKFEEAEKIFHSLSENAFEKSMHGRAIYEIGLIKNGLGNRQEAKKYFLKLITTYPDHGLCCLALKKTMLIVKEKSGEGAVKALMLELLPDALKSSFGDDVLWELAKLEKKNGNLDEAGKHLLMIHKGYPYPQGGAAFEYLFLLSEIEEEKGNFGAAVDWLQTIVDTTEKSYLLGDYNDDAKAQALLRMGKVYFEKMDEPERAYKTFMKVVKLDWPIRSDDGLWWAAQVRFAQNRNEDACGLLKKLIKKFEYSNFRRKSLKIVQGLKCAGAHP